MSKLSRRGFLGQTAGTAVASAGLTAARSSGAAALTGTRAEIKEHNGAPTLFINGEPHSAFSYMTYTPDKDYFEAFGDAGVHLYSFPANADGHTGWGMKDVWVAPDEFDYSGEDAMYRMIVSADSDARIFPRLHTQCPNWWIEEHPDQLVAFRNEQGELTPLEYGGRKLTYPSWASESALSMMEEAVRRYVRHVRDGRFRDYVIGYQIGSWAVAEWMAVCIDASAPMKERFRRYLREEYGTDAALRAAWGDPAVTLDTALCPADAHHQTPASQSFYDVPENQQLIDYWRNYEEVVTDAVLRLTQAAKEECLDESLVGAFYGYILELGGGSSFHGHAGLHRLLESESIDFFSSPSSYRRRDLYNGASYFMSLPESVKLHGKMWWDENDYRTYLVRPDRTMRRKRSRP